MLKRGRLVLAGIVLATIWAGAARADLAPEPIPGAGDSGMMIVAGVALAAIVAVVAVMLLRRRR